MRSAGADVVALPASAAWPTRQLPPYRSHADRSLTSNQALAEPEGLWKRPNGEIAEVYSCNARLCCKISKGAPPGFEMSNGMSRTGDNSWRGGSMKHPEMPGFMTFNGTVTLAGATLTIKGCVVGESVCNSENWVRAN